MYYVLFAGVRQLNSSNELSQTCSHFYTSDIQLRLATLLIQAVIETLLAFMHHFPLFALMLRMKDPWRLPGMSSSVPILSPFSSTNTWYVRRCILRSEISRVQRRDLPDARGKSQSSNKFWTIDLLFLYQIQPISVSSIFFQYSTLDNFLKACNP